jgi:uncharacterized delta-60 repeat protein
MLSNVKKIMFSLLLFSAAMSVMAQPGTNDASFNPTDIGFGYGDGANAHIYTSAVQSDGKIIIGGVFNAYSGTGRSFIARLNVDGSLDASFDPGTGANNWVHTVALQPDGKIIIGGNFTTYNGTGRIRMARLNTDGSLDVSFNPGTGASATVLSSALQSDGKIIIGGSFITFSGSSRNYIARLNADGSLDTDFNPGTGASSTVKTVKLQPDGKIIIGGDFISFNSTSINRIARLNTDGSLDVAFNPGTGSNSSIESTLLQPDGKIIIGGNFTTYNGTNINRIARLNADGGLDLGFDPGTGAGSFVYGLALQPDGKMIIGGDFTTYNGTAISGIARLNADGSHDTGFDPGAGVNGTVRTIMLRPDGKIIIVGDFTSYNNIGRNRIALLNIDGSQDFTIYPGTGLNGLNSSDVLTIVLQPNGKTIIGGIFMNYNGTSRNRIARLNADGSLDATFNPGIGASSSIETALLQPDGKIIIGGNFTSYNGTGINRIARLSTDGSLDLGFDPGAGADGIIYKVVLQPDGKIIIAGNFSTYNGTGRVRIARLNADGSLDAGFNPGLGANNAVRTIMLQPDGKIIIGGQFTTYGGTSINRIARLNIDGSLDVGFAPTGTGLNSTVRTIVRQSDGKIIIGGDFANYNGTTRSRIARLYDDGSLDLGFVPTGTGLNNIVWTTVLQPDGKIVIGGQFTTYNGTGRNRIARLNDDGSLDTDFNPGTGAGNNIWTAALQPDGKLMIGGSFTSYNGTGRNRLARIFSTESTLPLRFLEFSGSSQGNDHNLNWKTADEQNTSHFDIERSLDARNFTKIGSVVSANQSGIHVYSFSDTKSGLLGSKSIYYRLRQVDLDGKFSYSKVIAFSLNAASNNIQLYPNPVNHEVGLNISLNKAEKLEVRILDQSGRIMTQQKWDVQKGDSYLPINVQALLPGVYWLELKSEHIRETRQFVKQ